MWKVGSGNREGWNQIMINLQDALVHAVVVCGVWSFKCVVWWWWWWWWWWQPSPQLSSFIIMIMIIIIIIIIISSRLNISTTTHSLINSHLFFSFAAKKGYICDSLRTDSLSLWGGDLRVQNFELRTDELARVPWSKTSKLECTSFVFWSNDGVERVEFATEWLQKSELSFCLLCVLNSWRVWFFYVRLWVFGLQICSSLFEDAWTWKFPEAF